MSHYVVIDPENLRAVAGVYDTDETGYHIQWCRLDLLRHVMRVYPSKEIGYRVKEIVEAEEHVSGLVVIDVNEVFEMLPRLLTGPDEDDMPASQQDQYDTAVAEGREAFLSGMRINDNPYPVNDLRVIGWNNGWIGAQHLSADRHDELLG